ncbi:MAG: 1-phosphofructokinase family hexose kinase [Fimbriimonadales bacterium]|nr:1-phosphofructokinase family hexose kinase [Fimbriimonadales bacterium]
MIVSVTLNPCVDRVVFVPGLKVGDTNRVQRVETDAGGKGVNLSRVVAELGGKTTATGFLGGGPGAFVRHVLHVQGVHNSFVEVAHDTRVNTSIECGQGPPTTLNEAGPFIGEEEWHRLLGHCELLFERAHWVALGGSLPPGCPGDAFRQLGELAHRHGCRLLLDADGEPMRLGLEAGPDLIKPNLKEAERLVGRSLPSLDDALSAARELLAASKRVLLSMGKNGAVLAGPDGVWVGHSPPVEARSTIGSGDSMLGALLWALEEGEDWPEALRWGLAAGAATATTDGSEIARRPVVRLLYKEARVERRA